LILPRFNGKLEGSAKCFKIRLLGTEYGSCESN
jgi:hypothetical protein